jgi:hypothetical protein
VLSVFVELLYFRVLSDTHFEEMMPHVAHQELGGVLELMVINHVYDHQIHHVKK